MLAAPLELGDAAPDFELPVLLDPNTTRDSGGYDTVRLSELRGKVVYLDFWQTACAPCREAIPWFNALENEFSSQGLEIIAVNTDFFPTDALAFLERYVINYLVASDPTALVADSYGVKGCTDRIPDCARWQDLRSHRRGGGRKQISEGPFRIVVTAEV